MLHEQRIRFLARMNTTTTEQSTVEPELLRYVYIMTNARSGPYRIGLATSVKDIDGLRKKYKYESCGYNVPEPRDIFLSVWYEECVNQREAQKRADEISLMPYPWQRRLIESVNPQWIDYSGLGMGLPHDWLCVVPEIAGMPFRTLY